MGGKNKKKITTQNKPFPDIITGCKQTELIPLHTLSRRGSITNTLCSFGGMSVFFFFLKKPLWGGRRAQGWLLALTHPFVHIRNSYARGPASIFVPYFQSRALKRCSKSRLRCHLGSVRGLLALQQLKTRQIQAAKPQVCEENSEQPWYVTQGDVELACSCSSHPSRQDENHHFSAGALGCCQPLQGCVCWKMIHYKWVE